MEYSYMLFARSLERKPAILLVCMQMRGISHLENPNVRRKATFFFGDKGADKAMFLSIIHLFA